MIESITYCIEEFDKILAGVSKPDKNTNYTLFGAYEASISVCNKYLNFQQTIFDEDIEPIVNSCRKNGIHEFTISYEKIGLFKTLEAFEKLGCKIEGFTKARRYPDAKPIRALKLRIK